MKVTNFWDLEVFPADPEGKGEITKEKNLVDAAKVEDVKFFIWSSLPDITELLKGLYKHVYHCDSKAVILDYLKAPSHMSYYTPGGGFIENLSSPSLHPSALLINASFGSLQKTDAGYIPIPKFAPEERQAATCVAHPAALGILKPNADRSKNVLGSSYLVNSFKFTYPELAAGACTVYLIYVVDTRQQAT
ncbi:hypothetical protein C8R45DRAFT_1095873 [Mycena sanguinolenta]|nr:hypothetical protein C8R45DRAFT_1095873 [Mycena sanguinolenta]